MIYWQVSQKKKKNPNSEYMTLNVKMGRKGFKIQTSYAVSAMEIKLFLKKYFCGTAARIEGGRKRAAMLYYQRRPSQCHGDHLSCHSNLCYRWLFVCVYACVVLLIKGKRLARGQVVRSSL